MDRGHTAAQVTHAAGESAGLLDQPIPPHTIAVVLGVPPAELAFMRARLVQADIEHVLVREEDGPYAGQLMAIGVKPAQKLEVYPYMKRLHLLK